MSGARSATAYRPSGHNEPGDIDITSAGRSWFRSRTPARGKSRIDLPADRRDSGWPWPWRLDTVTAAAQCGTVMAIVETETDAAALGAVQGVIAHRTSVTGLNESIRDGVKALSGSGRAADRVAVLPGDLPGLEPDGAVGGAPASALSTASQWSPTTRASAPRLLAATEPGGARPAVRTRLVSPASARRRGADRVA